MMVELQAAFVVITFAITGMILGYIIGKRSAKKGLWPPCLFVEMDKKTYYIFVYHPGAISKQNCKNAMQELKAYGIDSMWLRAYKPPTVFKFEKEKPNEPIT